MKIVVIGGTGLIGSKVVDNLRKLGHEPLAASPSKGINSVTGEGLAEALQGAAAVVDVSNSPSFKDADVLSFFTASTRNLLEAASKAGVQHYVALSIVGTDGLPNSGYMRAKVAQEALIKEAKVPYTIVRATQFFEFLGSIAYVATEGNTVRLPSAYMQPIVSDDVANAIAAFTLDAPANGIVELAGPEKIPMDELVKRFLQAQGDERQVVTDDKALYFGTALGENSLVPEGDNPVIGATTFEQWLNATVAQA
jgi:uncharacterized protein YbjT (DUF2867 family)